MLLVPTLALLADPADLDGDGSEDLLVAAPRNDRGAGRAYVVRGW